MSSWGSVQSLMAEQRVSQKWVEGLGFRVSGFGLRNILPVGPFRDVFAGESKLGIKPAPQS